MASPILCRSELANVGLLPIKSGTICTYLPFFNVITASPSRARASNYYLAFVVASLVITSIANILMWHIYSTERYMPAAFAGWAGFIVAYVGRTLPKLLNTTTETN